jgi:hypothetical protein
MNHGIVSYFIFINISSQFMSSSSVTSVPPPPRIPESEPRLELQFLRNSRGRNLISSQLARYQNPSKPKPKTRKPREVEYLFIVTPDNGANGPPKLPKSNSNLFTVLENRGLIKPIKFTEDDAHHCNHQIQQTFRDLLLISWYFYRPDGRSQNLHRAETVHMANCNLRALLRYSSTNL